MEKVIDYLNCGISVIGTVFTYLFGSWDKALIDTPILDIVNLYKNEYYHTTFEPILSKYFELVSLHEDEKTLLFIMLSLPWQVVKTQSEFDNCKNYNELLDYIYKTENLIRPYYSKK